MQHLNLRPPSPPLPPKIFRRLLWIAPFDFFFQVLKLCQAITASLGSENRSAATQVLHFITAHECIVRVGLHFSNLFTLAGLQELSLLTGVISRSVTFETSTFEFDSPELASHLSR